MRDERTYLPCAAAAVLYSSPVSHHRPPSKNGADAAGSGGGGDSDSGSGSNVFLDKFLELPPALLKRMNLGLHVRAATADGEGATEGAFELLSLALTRHKGPDPDEDAADGDGEEEGEGATGQPLGLDVVSGCVRL